MSGFVSRFELGAKIGAGFFGEVFLGKDPVHGQVATKVLRRGPSLTLSDWQAQKSGWLAEARHIRTAQHRNVVVVHHLIEATGDDAVLYVMEHCPNGCLTNRYKSGPLPLSVVKRVATDAASGLGAIHARGMLHRDIKPSNILEANDGVFKIGDFGLVTDNLVAGYGSQAGYSDHVAPEVHRGGPTSIRSDIWALGMTLYRLLHGHQWYEEGPAPRLVVANGGYADGLKWLPHVPKAWRRAIRSMLRDDPADRLQNCQQVMEALAPLRTDPAWACDVQTGTVVWTRQTANRMVEVRWRNSGPKDNKWSAVSSPLGGQGRNRTLRGSGVPVSRVDAERLLDRFFTQ